MQGKDSKKNTEHKHIFSIKNVTTWCQIDKNQEIQDGLDLIDTGIT